MVIKNNVSECEKCNEKSLHCKSCQLDLEKHGNEYEKYRCFIKRLLIKQVKYNDSMEEILVEYIHLVNKCGLCLFKNLWCCL